MRPNNLLRHRMLRIAASLSFLLTSSVCLATDWSNWRGPLKTGVSLETGLPDNFDEVLWMKKDVGCRSTPIVMNDKVYIVSRIGEGAEERERVVCMDAKTGETVWEHQFAIFFTPIVSVRLGWTVAAGDPETGNVYAHGTQGFLFCFDGATGEVKWKRSLTEELGRITGYGGRVTSPVVDGDLVMISMLSSNWGSQAGGGCRFFAFDKNTGEIVWGTKTGFRPSNSYRCIPIVVTLNGQRVLISGGGDGRMHAFQVSTGKKVWSYELGNGAMNPAPVLDGNLLYCAHGEEIPGRATVGRLVCLDVSKPEPTLVWEIDGIEFKYPSPMLYNGKVYLPDRQGRLYCYDGKTGERLWRAKFGRNCTGSPVVADGKIYISSVHGYFHILNAETGKRINRKRFQPADPQFDVEVQGSAAIANGSVFFGTTEEFYCLGSYKPSTVEYPELPSAPGPNPSGKPEQLRVVPAEISIQSGESVTFTAQLFDSDGRLVSTATPELKLAPMSPGPGLGEGAVRPPLQGTIDGVTYTAPASGKGQSGQIIASVNGLETNIRVRQRPSYPYSEDFESTGVGTIPGGWTNTQLRYVTLEKDGNTVLSKTARIAVPFYRQWYAFIGGPDDSGYTIESDVMGEQVGTYMPNMGVTANRYILQLVGSEQSLRLSAWDAIPRVAAEVPYPWKADTWYRIKMFVEVGEESGKVYGKVWPKDSAEPAEWTVELEDPNPNRTGPPGLYGSAQGIQPPKLGTQIFYDNVLVK
ncbi:MAG: PQQ-binding-like beta-propeller repeat protein [Pirellulaceae bacterium]